MKKTKNCYGVDLGFEFRTYKNVGRDYGKAVSVERYTVCDNYDEWKKHVKKLSGKMDQKNLENFSHYLKAKKRDAEKTCQSFELLLIPVSLSFLSLLEVPVKAGSGENFARFVLLIGFSVLYAMLTINQKNEKEFFEDFIEVVNDSSFFEQKQENC